jgi:hypothetical protein
MGRAVVPRASNNSLVDERMLYLSRKLSCAYRDSGESR